MNAQNSLANSGQLQNVLQGMSGFTSPIGAYGSTTSGQTTQEQLTSLLNSMFGNTNNVQQNNNQTNTQGQQVGSTNSQGYTQSNGTTTSSPNSWADIMSILGAIGGGLNAIPPSA